MSLNLIQGYSSAEEEEAEERTMADYENSDEDDDDSHAVRRYGSSSVIDLSGSSSNGSGLPSALDAFSQVSGPPAFLNNRKDADEEASVRDQEHAKRGRHKEKQDVPTGAVLEAKPQLVGIHERVRSDMESKQPSQTGEKRKVTAANPSAEDAADLLRMCLQCEVPKTYSSARGMVCPVCGDRPLADPNDKKKGSTVKDKEKSKRMRGQSSHATWKSETEMHLRQQFD